MALVLVVTSPAGVGEVEECRRDTVGGVHGCVGAWQTREEMKHSARLRASHLHAHIDLLLLGRGLLDHEG